MSEPYWSTLGGAAIDYEGAWNPATQYAAGDIVRYGGVDYIAVNPSLGVNPGVATGYTPPVNEVGARFTASVLCTATSEASATQLVAAPAMDFDGVQAAHIDFWAPGYVATDAPVFTVYLFDGSTSIGTGWSKAVAAGTFPDPLVVATRLVPSAGSHTFSARATVSSGAGVNVRAGTGAPSNLLPGSIRVRRVAA